MKNRITKKLCTRAALSVGILTVALGLGSAAPVYAASLYTAAHDGTNGLAGSVAGLVGQRTSNVARATGQMSGFPVVAHDGTNGVAGSVTALASRSAARISRDENLSVVVHDGTNGVAGSVTALASDAGSHEVAQTARHMKSL